MRRNALLLIAFLSISDRAIAQAHIPDLLLRVAVRQKEDGKVDQGIHILNLQCQKGECWLTSVSLNQCRDRGFGGQTFPVVVEMASTVDGRLKVANLGDTLKVEQVATDIGGAATNTYLFGYETFDDGLDARLTSFSGGFVKHSTLLDRVISVEYVPFRRMAQTVKLDCAVLVPGVDLSDFDDLIETFSEVDRAAFRRLRKDPAQPLLTDDNRGRRLFPDYDDMKVTGKQFSDDQWRKYVQAYLDEQDGWLKDGGVSASARQKLRQFQSDVLLEQLKKK